MMKMKRKIMGLLICILFLTTISSAMNTFQIEDEKSIEESSDNRLFVFWGI